MAHPVVCGVERHQRIVVGVVIVVQKVPKHQAALVAYIMVDPPGELVVFIWNRQIVCELVCALVWKGQKRRRELNGNRIKTAGWNDVVGKWLPCQRIPDRAGAEA